MEMMNDVFKIYDFLEGQLSLGEINNLLARGWLGLIPDNSSTDAELLDIGFRLDAVVARLDSETIIFCKNLLD